MTPVRRLILGFAAAALVNGLAGALPAFAHHSFSMFDSTKEVTLTGVVKSYAFRMPHVWFFILAPGANGAEQEWGLEMGSPNIGVRKGWNVNSLKPGDKVTVTMHPMTSGASAGSVMKVIMPDGRTLLN